MKKTAKITMTMRETAAETFERFLLTKHSNGVKAKTIAIYSQHFRAISKHLDISQEITKLTAADLREMVSSMRDSGLAPNSIKSYTITMTDFQLTFS